MNSFVITYDIVNEAKARYRGKLTALTQIIEITFPFRARPLDSVWIVRSAYSAMEVRDLLLRHLDGDDRLLVLQSARNAAWSGMDSDMSHWLRENV